jgi:acylphosphatase
VTKLHVRISGRVQGVGFRWFVREEARRLGLSGWVTNLASGDVEVSASGEDRAVARLRRALEVGPTGAQVSAVLDVDEPAPPSLPYPFAIHR